MFNSFIIRRQVNSFHFFRSRRRRRRRAQNDILMTFRKESHKRQDRHRGYII